ncbi:MAG: cytidyltransferase [Porticoccaceae bacterium]|jgi:nicotinamide mononucleotide adenylyltransferase|nr:cytidyltransferase [Porticoccaceae bacterium]|tara:strand:- start:5359 stop:5706 length:348 start_codon:yes stop_codon:yes gene_type:complete
MFDWTKPTAQMLGRFQPWHDGHTQLFKKALEKTGQVVIMLRTTVEDSDNPYSIDERVMQIAERLTNEHITTDYYTIISVPNISSICYGRAVGYTIDEIKLDPEIESISATRIRNE